MTRAIPIFGNACPTLWSPLHDWRWPACRWPKKAQKKTAIS